MSEAAEFRAETRAWLEENCPAGARGPGNVPWGSRKIDLPKDSREWLENMAAKGWTVPTWPKAYGGAELDSVRYLILLDELRRINALTAQRSGGKLYWPHHFGVRYRRAKGAMVAGYGAR